MIKQKQEFTPDNRDNRCYSNREVWKSYNFTLSLTTSRLPLALTRWHVLRLPDKQSLMETFSSFSTAFHIRCDTEVKEELQGTLRSAYKKWAACDFEFFCKYLWTHTTDHTVTHCSNNSVVHLCQASQSRYWIVWMTRSNLDYCQSRLY